MHFFVGSSCITHGAYPPYITIITFKGKLYKKSKFDIEKFKRVQEHVNRIEIELKAITIENKQKNCSKFSTSHNMEGN